MNILMKRLLLLSVFTFLAGCASSGYNLEEAISKWITYPISDSAHRGIAGRSCCFLSFS